MVGSQALGVEEVHELQIVQEDSLLQELNQIFHDLAFVVFDEDAEGLKEVV